MEEVTSEETMVESAGQDGEAPAAETASDEAQAELAELRSALEQRDLEIQSLQNRLASATARYREALLAAAPDVPEELVGGESPEEVENSLAGARQMVERVRGANRVPDCRRARPFRCAGKREPGVQRHVVTGEDSLRPDPARTGAVMPRCEPR